MTNLQLNRISRKVRVNTQVWRKGPIIRLGADKNHTAQGGLGGRVFLHSYLVRALKLIFSIYFQCLHHMAHDSHSRKGMSGLSSLVKR